MAANRHAKVSGKSIKELMSIDPADFNRLDERELKTITSRLASAANKRLRRFEKSGISTPATRRAEESGGFFSVKGKTLNQTRAEFMRAKQFLEAKTSTRRGWETTRKNTIARLRDLGVNVTKDQLDELWQAYEKLKEMSPEVESASLKYDVLKGINERITAGVDADSAAISMLDEIKGIYEERAAADEDGGVSGFFEF